MESLERDLEIYQRELGKAVDQAKSYRQLIKGTEAKIEARDAAEAARIAAAEKADQEQEQEQE